MATRRAEPQKLQFSVSSAAVAWQRGHRTIQMMNELCQAVNSARPARRRASQR
jgi:hypothetical protein